MRSQFNQPFPQKVQMRILILAGIGILAFSIIFVPGYFLIVPRPDAQTQEQNMQFDPNMPVVPDNPGEFEGLSGSIPLTDPGTPPGTQ